MHHWEHHIFRAREALGISALEVLWLHVFVCMYVKERTISSAGNSCIHYSGLCKERYNVNTVLTQHCLLGVSCVGESKWQIMKCLPLIFDPVKFKQKYVACWHTSWQIILIGNYTSFKLVSFMEWCIIFPLMREVSFIFVTCTYNWYSLRYGMCTYWSKGTWLDGLC